MSKIDVHHISISKSLKKIKKQNMHMSYQFIIKCTHPVQRQFQTAPYPFEEIL